MHALSAFLVLRPPGAGRPSQPEDQANQASCVNLVTNAVIVWNTVYMGAVIDRLRAKGEQIAFDGSRAPLTGEGTTISIRMGGISSRLIAGLARCLCDPSIYEPSRQSERWFLSVCYRKAMRLGRGPGTSRCLVVCGSRS